MYIQKQFKWKNSLSMCMVYQTGKPYLRWNWRYNDLYLERVKSQFFKPDKIFKLIWPDKAIEINTME